MSLSEYWEKALSKGFAKAYNKLKLISCANGKCIAELTVGEEHLNIYNTLHGGLIATLVDHVTSFAIVGMLMPTPCPSFSVNINLSYLNKAQLGDVIVIESDCNKSGRNIAFTQAKVFLKKDPTIIIATGDHVKFFAPKSISNNESSSVKLLNGQTD